MPRPEDNKSVFTKGIAVDKRLKIPIAHGEGNYYIDEDGLIDLIENRQILFRYIDKNQNQNPDANPNGSKDAIDGIINKKGNVMGMMPHPERAVESILGSVDGCAIFKSLLN